MAWMLRLECCPLVRNHSRFQVAPVMDRFHKSHQKFNGTKSQKKNPDQGLVAFSSKKIDTQVFFWGVMFGSVRGSCRSDFFLEFSANFDVEDWKMTLEELRLGYSNLWDQTWSFSSVEGSKLANCSILAILCDLFGMVKWPFKRLSDVQLGDQKVTLNHLDSAVSLFSSIFNYNFSCCFMLFTASTLNSCFHWV